MPYAKEPGAILPVVLFDADCPLCISLAEHARRRATGALRFVSWQDFQSAPDTAALLPVSHHNQGADRLRVLIGLELLEGDAAWAFLLERYRDLAGLNWLAAKVGLHPQLARAAAATGLWARRFCTRCPRPQRR